MTRGKFQGVTQIVRFNWPIYLVALVIFVSGDALSFWLPMAWRILLLAGIALAAFWLIVSLAVSHYVYDRGPIYHSAWIKNALPIPPKVWANFHAGLDEFSEILHEAFPASDGSTVDFFAEEMSEPSIRRARELTKAKSTAVDFRSLPFRDQSLDAASVFFSAHELRAEKSRAQFFAELRRVLKQNGRLMVLEHLRDLPNFLAFGPGAFHFHSRASWLRAAKEFKLTHEFSLTPFVRVFVFENV